jgi:tol-pal system protein YbgF
MPQLQRIAARALNFMARFAFRQASALALVVVAAASGGLYRASAQEPERSPGLFDVFFGGSERLAGERSTQGQPLEHTAQAGPPDLLVRLERLESQIRQLTGVIEQLQYRNTQLETQVRRMQEEQELGGKGSPRPQPQARSPGVPIQPVPAGPPSPARRGDAFDPASNPNAPGAPHSLGSMAEGRAGVEVAMPQSQLVPPRTAPSGALPATLPPSQTPQDEFDLAYGYLLRHDYALAEDSFRAFLGKYPTDRLTGEATFWFGETLFQRQRFRDAAEAFLNVSTKFEASAKAPDALLRLGQSLAALGEKEASCASLGEVLRKFPRASAAVKQAVAREQKRVRC